MPLIKDLEREASSLLRGTRQASALGLEGGGTPLESCSARHVEDPYSLVSAEEEERSLINQRS